MASHMYSALALVLPLAFLFELHRSLETDPVAASERFDIKAANLTDEEANFLSKVVNYETEEELKYLVLNKTQEMYSQNYERLYKEAEEKMSYNDDHLKIKFKSHFDEFTQFKILYYNHLEAFFTDKILQHLPDSLKKARRLPPNNRTAFLLAEEAIDLRHERIVRIFDWCLRNHVLHVDDTMNKDFFNHTRQHLWDTLYKPLAKFLPEGSHYDYFISGQ